VVDASTGAVAQAMSYDAWGNVTSDSNPGFQPFGYAGGLYDRDLKLVRFGARDYDPETGRWTSKDGARLRGGLNVYRYTTADPMNLQDLSGFDIVYAGTTGSVQFGAAGNVSSGGYVDTSTMSGGVFQTTAGGVGVGVPELPVPVSGGAGFTAGWSPSMAGFSDTSTVYGGSLGPVGLDFSFSDTRMSASVMDQIFCSEEAAMCFERVRADEIPEMWRGTINPDGSQEATSVFSGFALSLTASTPGEVQGLKATTVCR
jgi:RHS repeat-associated protein